MSSAFVTVLRGNVGGTAQTVADSTWTTVLFDIIQTDGVHTTMYDTATGVFTIPVNGWYDLESEITWAATGGTLKATRIIRQDPNFPIFVGQYDDTVLTTRIRHRGYFSLGETLSIQVYQDSGIGADIAASLDPDAVGQPGHCTNAMITLIKEVS